MAHQQTVPNKVTFYRVQYSNRFESAATKRPGVYIGKQWVGDILEGNAFFPLQITVNGVRSPCLRPKPGVKGNIKRTIRDGLVQWAVNTFHKT